MKAREKIKQTRRRGLKLEKWQKMIGKKIKGRKEYKKNERKAKRLARRNI